MATEPSGHCFSPASSYNWTCTFYAHITNPSPWIIPKTKIKLARYWFKLLHTAATCYKHFFVCALDNCACIDRKLSTHKGANSSQPASGCVLKLGTCVSEAGKWKDSGQQGQTRQPLRSHQVCRDTLEHSKPDGICPPGGAKQARWQTDTEAGKERRKNGGWRILPPNAQYVPATCMQLWTVTLTSLWTNYTVTPCR